ncbi:thiamine diphosphokinase [Frigidibacter sp. SLM-1]|nr:thiamine diphosphokinase [Frigidibacter sp. ROC022]MCR8725281.1 thiamine diphosphokinase [Frigidibacter sp. ROC022]
MENVTLLGAGEVTAATLAEALTLAPNLVAADGAAAKALSFGHLPTAVIGDLDSIDGASREKIPADRLHLVAEQESTDFEKCLAAVSAPLILGVGFMGARLDHELAAYNALVRHPDRRCILIGPVDICFHAPPELLLEVEPGARVSLFPMAKVTGRSEGLHWPIEGLRFAPDGRIGTSNAAHGPVRLEFDGPGMLVILPRQALRAAITALGAVAT